ncbi:MAG: YdcF family protein [Leptolyngbya sp. BL-A-14]
MAIDRLPFTIALQIDAIRLSWVWIDWLSDPSRVVVTLLFVSALPWFFRTQRWLQRIRQWAIVLLLGYLLLISPPVVSLAMAGITRPLPADPGTTVDAIVILGRGREQSPPRVKVAAQLWRDRRAPKIFVSGIVDAPELVAMLRTQQVPAQAVSGESCSRTTWENAVFTKAVLQPQGVKQILLVTDVPHLWRSLLIFEQIGFQVIPYASPLASAMTTPQRAMLLIREYFFLAIYPKTLQQERRTLEQPITRVVEQIAHQECLIKD